MGRYRPLPFIETKWDDIIPTDWKIIKDLGDYEIDSLGSRTEYAK